MRRLIVMIALLAAIGGGAYLFIFKKKELQEGYDSARGYPAAKNAKEAADLFRKAIKERDYKDAAKYCTEAYAREMIKAADGARDLGKAVDNLTHRLTEDQLITDETRLILFLIDPFPKQIMLAVGRESETDAAAVISYEGIRLEGNLPTESWSVDLNMLQPLTKDVPRTIRVVKQGTDDKAVWKLDIPASANLQQAVTRLTENYKAYSRQIQDVSDKVKRDPQTKLDIKQALRTALEKARE